MVSTLLIACAIRASIRVRRQAILVSTLLIACAIRAGSIALCALRKSFNAINSMRNTRTKRLQITTETRFNAINSMRNTRFGIGWIEWYTHCFNAINSMRNTRSWKNYPSVTSCFNAINSMRNTRVPAYAMMISL